MKRSLIAKEFSIPLRVVQYGGVFQPGVSFEPEQPLLFLQARLFTELVPIPSRILVGNCLRGERERCRRFQAGGEGAANLTSRSFERGGLDQSRDRELSAQSGLQLLRKAQMACLSSRVPYGEAVTPEKLAMIGGQKCLRDIGFINVRVRHHELKGGI